jgi:hypothetical protein
MMKFLIAVIDTEVTTGTAEEMKTIEADSFEQAERLANQGSVACNRKVELRPFLGN